MMASFEINRLLACHTIQCSMKSCDFGFAGIFSFPLVNTFYTCTSLCLLAYQLLCQKNLLNF